MRGTRAALAALALSACTPSDHPCAETYLGAGCELDSPCREIGELTARCVDDPGASRCAELVDEDSDLHAQVVECSATEADSDELADRGFESQTLEYDIAAPIDAVWDFYVSMHPAKLLGDPILFESYDCSSGLTVESIEGFPGFEAGMRFDTKLQIVLKLSLDMEVTEVDPIARRIEFAYLDSAPAIGWQSIHFEPAPSPSGLSATRVIHHAEYRGKNIINHLLYPPTHRAVFDPYHETAQWLLERFAILDTACDLDEPVRTESLRGIEWLGPLYASPKFPLTSDQATAAACDYQALAVDRLRPFPKDDDDLIDAMRALARGGSSSQLEPLYDACAN